MYWDQENAIKDRDKEQFTSEHIYLRWKLQLRRSTSLQEKAFFPFECKKNSLSQIQEQPNPLN